MSKQFQCNNLCKSNCCSSVIFALSDTQLKTFKEKGFFIAHKKFADFKWVKLHDGINVEKKAMIYKVSIKDGVDYEIIKDSPLKKDCLFIYDKCSKLLDNNRCKIYRARPKGCREGKCEVFEKHDKMVIWIAEHGLLKDVRKKHYEH